MLKNWIAYYLTLLASLVFALLYPGRTSSAFFYALLLMPLASLGLSALLLTGFRYVQQIDAMAAAKGDTVTYRITAGNRSLMMLPYVELFFYSADSALGRDFTSRKMAVLPHGKSNVTIQVACKYKGLYEVGIKQIKFKDYLGLFTFHQSMGKLGDLVVYPRIVPVEAFPVMAGYTGESHASAGNSQERTDTVSDIRKYVNGDRLRSIHWKLSAKKDELMVKNFEQASGSCAELIIDASAIGSGMRGIEQEERLVECAVALSYYFARNSVSASLHFYCGGLVRQRLNGINDFRLAYRMLSEASFCPGAELPDIAGLVLDEGPARKTVAVVSAGLSADTAGQLQRLASAGFHVAVIHAAPDSEERTDETAQLIQTIKDAGMLYWAVGPGEDIGMALARRAV